MRTRHSMAVAEAGSWAAGDSCQRGLCPSAFRRSFVIDKQVRTAGEVGYERKAAIILPSMAGDGCRCLTIRA